MDCRSIFPTPNTDKSLWNLLATRVQGNRGQSHTQHKPCGRPSRRSGQSSVASQHSASPTRVAPQEGVGDDELRDRSEQAAAGLQHAQVSPSTYPGVASEELADATDFSLSTMPAWRRAPCTLRNSESRPATRAPPARLGLQQHLQVDGRRRGDAEHEAQRRTMRIAGSCGS